MRGVEACAFGWILFVKGEMNWRAQLLPRQFGLWTWKDQPPPAEVVGWHHWWNHQVQQWMHQFLQQMFNPCLFQRKWALVWKRHHFLVTRKPTLISSTSWRMVQPGPQVIGKSKLLFHGDSYPQGFDWRMVAQRAQTVWCISVMEWSQLQELIHSQSQMGLVDLSLLRIQITRTELRWSLVGKPLNRLKRFILQVPLWSIHYPEKIFPQFNQRQWCLVLFDIVCKWVKAL